MKRNAIFILYLVMALMSCGSVMRSNIGGRGAIIIEKDVNPPLPEGIVAVEYIESTGVQVIVTPYYFHAYSAVEADLEWETLPTRRDGYWGVNGIFQFNYSLAYGSRCICRCWRDNAHGPYNYVNGALKQTYEYPNYSGYLTLFGLGLSYYTTFGRVYWVRFKVDGKVYYDMIPVRFVNELGYEEGALYDFISGELFRNSGSNNFIIGPDL